jgi:hypothetical protein
MNPELRSLFLGMVYRCRVRDVVCYTDRSLVQLHLVGPHPTYQWCSTPPETGVSPHGLLDKIVMPPCCP